MKTKKFNHNKIEKCKLSKKKIDTSKENYSIILDCVGSSINSIGFYKTEVLRDLIQGKGKEVAKSFIEQQKEVVNKMLSSVSAFNPQNKEVYEVGNN